MNCQTFSELVSDIARDQMMDAAIRGQALAHTKECVSCAVQLRDQQRLTSDLRELVAAIKDEITSPVVWDRLSATFDSRKITHVKSNRRGLYAAGAIAAMLIVAFGLVQRARQRQPTYAEATITATFSGLPAQTNERKEKDVIVAVNRKSPVVRHRLPPAPRGLTIPINQPKEIATDFIVLTYDGEVGSDAQMVRVELPRSAMAGFGLPVNMDRADQRVKADVLMGADGLARAIRFVQ